MARELHALARTLRDIALTATAEPGEPRVSPTVLAIVEDVAHHPRTPVKGICERTGLSQSVVSMALKRLSSGGAVTTSPDPADRRRRLVSVTALLRVDEFENRGSRPIEEALRETLPLATPARLARIARTLEQLSRDLLGETARP